MNLTELGAALGPFFDISGSPSHQQLRDAFARHGLGHLDPAPEGRTSNGSHLGKMKRIRHVFASPAAHNATAGLPLARELVALCRAHGGFNPDSESYAGSGRVTQLVQAFAPLGFTLEPDGSTRPTVIDKRHRTHSDAAQLRRQNQLQPRRRPATGRHGKGTRRIRRPPRSDRTPG